MTDLFGDTKRLTATDMIAMLRRHYLPEGRPAGGLFAPEIGSPDGRRRADLIWMPATIAGGTGLVGHEVKVSRSDVLAELADPTKAEPWAQYCTRWWLVVADPALVAGLDIPEAWGIMAPPSGRRTRTMTVVRQAPALKPTEPAPGYARLAAWEMYRHAEAEAALRRDLEYATARLDDAEKRAHTAVVAGVVSNEAARVAKIVRAIENAAGRGWLYTREGLDDDAIADAVVDHLLLARATKDAEHELDRVSHDLRDAMTVLAGPLERLAEARRRIAAQSARRSA